MHTTFLGLKKKLCMPYPRANNHAYHIQNIFKQICSISVKCTLKIYLSSLAPTPIKFIISQKYLPIQLLRPTQEQAVTQDF